MSFSAVLSIESYTLELKASLWWKSEGHPGSQFVICACGTQMARMTWSPLTAPTQRSSGNNTADNMRFVLCRGGIMITVKN